MDCFLDDVDGRVQCSHHGENASACSTKLLWTRVQMGVIRSLQRTTLAELVEFDARPPSITVERREPGRPQGHALSGKSPQGAVPPTSVTTS
jgi:hypothetical protein